MTGVRALFGDALIAVGELVRGGSPNVDFDPSYKSHTKRAGWTAPRPLEEFTSQGHGSYAMECDGPLLAQPQLLRADNAIAPAEVRSALDTLADSKLLRIAATIIAGWKPILITSEYGRAAARDVDVLIATLRDRASQFEAVERDADEPFLSPVHLDDHLTRSAQPASE